MTGASSASIGDGSTFTARSLYMPGNGNHSTKVDINQVGVSGEVLRAARKLKLLHKWGVGVDNLDTATARELGIKVARTTGSNAVPVAEFTLGLIIGTLRNQAYGHAELKHGAWRGGRMPGAFRRRTISANSSADTLTPN